jgi:hypothetical protein
MSELTAALNISLFIVKTFKFFKRNDDKVKNICITVLVHQDLSIKSALMFEDQMCSHRKHLVTTWSLLVINFTLPKIEQIHYWKIQSKRMRARTWQTFALANVRPTNIFY